MAATFHYPSASWPVSSLNSLRQECLDWLVELSFIKDEIHFFQKLLRAIGSSEAADNRLMTRYEQQLRELATGEITELQGQIASHERYCVEILVNESAGEPIWAQTHQSLKRRVVQAQTDYRRVKRQFFLLLE